MMLKRHLISSHSLPRDGIFHKDLLGHSGESKREGLEGRYPPGVVWDQNS